MRTTDPEPEPTGRPILGERVQAPAPSPPLLRPHSEPRGPYGVVTLPDGTLRTTRDNLPKGT